MPHLAPLLWLITFSILWLTLFSILSILWWLPRPKHLTWPLRCSELVLIWNW